MTVEMEESLPMVVPASFESQQKRTELSARRRTDGGGGYIHADVRKIAPRERGY